MSQSQARVPFATLSILTSSKGAIYYAGFLGKAKLLGFPGAEPDKYGNSTVDLFVVGSPPRAQGCSVL